MHSIKKIVAFLLFSIIIAACKKKELNPYNNKQIENFHNGILVLNQGLMNQNNSSLDWIDLTSKKVHSNIFESKNKRPLGDTGNDMLAYGNKIYVVMSGSSTVEVIGKSDLKSEKQISFIYNGQPQQPRELVSYNGAVYVTSYDGYISIIDTVSLSIKNRIKVGRNPEGLIVSNANLFVANSGGLTPSNMDSTVFQINLANNHIVDTFVVGENPGDMSADDFGNVYVVKRGNYGNNPSELVKINTSTKEVQNLGILTTTISKKGTDLYLSYYDFSTNQAKVSVFDCATQSIVNSNLINTQEITTLYGVFPFKNDQIICIDAMNYTNTGYLRFYDSNSNYLYSIHVGLNPGKFIYYE